MTLNFGVSDPTSGNIMKPSLPRQVRTSQERRVHGAMADLIDVCLIYRSVLGVEPARGYCASLGLNDETIRRLLVDGRYRGWTIGAERIGADRRATGK